MSEGETQNAGLREFGLKVSRYFFDFLETDFKRQQAPRRRIQLKNDANQATGVALRKYEALQRAAIVLLSREGNGGRVFSVARGKFRAPISPLLRNLINQFIDQIDSDRFQTISTKILEAAHAKRTQAADDPEKYVSDVTAVLEAEVASDLVHPLLALLEKPIRESAYSAIESVFEIETDLIGALTEGIAKHLPEALNTLLVKNDDGVIQKVLKEFFDEAQSRQHLKEFFASFSTSDAWQELRDLQALTKTGENLQLYLYVCDLRFGNSLFPVVYVPLSVTQEEQSGELHFELDSRLYVNKRAVEYIAQELEISEKRRALSSVGDRIVYLDPGEAPAGKINRILTTLHGLFDLNRVPVLEETGARPAQSSRVRVSTACYVGVFDRSDEALLNDYESLIGELQSNQPAVAGLFENVIRGFLLEEPIKVDTRVDHQWEALSVPARLVTESPIPLNEEQRKILTALQQPEVRYVIVQGPPGTGKSHTITAIAFECILKRQTVLVLSDKTEALDVVEDKLTKAINRVRPNKGFQNPILRLGRSGGTYAKLLTQSSITAIQNQHRAGRSQRADLEGNIRNEKENLIQNIAASIDQRTGMSITDILRLHTLERSLGERWAEIPSALQKGPWPDLNSSVESVASWVNSTDGTSAVNFAIEAKPRTVGQFVALMRKAGAALSMGELVEYRSTFSLFRRLRPTDGPVLQGFVGQYENLRMPLFGYLFRRRRLRLLDAKVAETLPVENFLDLHRRLSDLRRICDLLPKTELHARAFGISDGEFAAIYEEIVHNERKFPDFGLLPGLVRDLGKAFHEWNLPDLAGWTIGRKGKFKDLSDFVAFCDSLGRLSGLWRSLSGREAKIPQFDFVGDRDKLEQLCAAKMTFEMDGRFLQFTEQSAATAKILASVVRQKQKFPTDTFQKLRDAFPCIIASIREFAEYIPLEQEMFDLVVIDEASQVSVAQAFPALLRAKKVLVLGDRRQFSNVKAAFASNERNSAFRNDLRTFFRDRVSDSAEKLQRAARFDVKRSVLDFFDLVANYSTMLRKHFRGYQELISFSSEQFYSGTLQAVKFRGKPIDEVIRFTILEHDGRTEKYRNTNSQEAKFIIDQLEAFLEMEKPPTVGVITPFREQVTLISKMVLEQPNARDYFDELKLKIMTFDSCQGEEREVIIYSMVATSSHDAINYVLPVQLKDAEDRVEEALKLQRINVGFSRAQECIHFVLSKPIEQFSGSARTALQHFKKILDDKSKGDPDETDPSSPMEANLLSWLKSAEFYQRNREDIELRPQFPIGDYLKQLDPLYRHPAYRVDFLLTFRDGDKVINVVIEYDGFKEHFTSRNQVDRANWPFYYRAEDLERQMTLESYGYKFLRVNRFNLGEDPVSTLSRRLFQLIDAAKNDKTNHSVVNNIQKDAQALADGQKRFCRKCGKIKALTTFYDKSLQGGKGGYGRYCLACKRN